MICRALSNEIVTRFGYRRPSADELRVFTRTVDQYRHGGAMSGTRAADLGIAAALIEKRLESIISGFFKQPSPELLGKALSKEEQVAYLMHTLGEKLTYHFDKVIAKYSGEPAEFLLKKVRAGIRTAIMIITLNFKMIVKKLEKVSDGLKDQFQKLSNQGLDVIKEIASIPQESILHSLVNFLCGRGLVDEMTSDDMILNESFYETKFEFADDCYGVSTTSVDDYVRQHGEEQARNPGFRQIYLDSLKTSVFGCPAKRVSIKLVIDDREQSVNYIEAIYRLAEKWIKANL